MMFCHRSPGLVTPRRERPIRMAADIAGAASDQNARLRHEPVSHRFYLDSKKFNLTFGRPGAPTLDKDCQQDRPAA